MCPRRSDEYTEAQRAAIVAAARRRFLRDGYDRTTLREVAREAGLSTGAIYTYFETKAELLAAICDAQVAAQRAALQHALASLPAGGDRFTAGLLAALAPFLAVAQEEVRERERVDLLFWYEAARDPHLGERMRGLVGEWRAALRDGLAAERSAGRLRADLDLDALCAVLIALPIGLTLVDLLGGAPLDREAFLRTAGAILDRGARQVAGDDSPRVGGRDGD